MADEKILRSGFVSVDRKLLRLFRNINFIYKDHIIKCREEVDTFNEMQNQLKSSIIESLEDKKKPNEESKMEELKLDQANLMDGNFSLNLHLIERMMLQKMLVDELSLSLRLHQKVMKALEASDRVSSEPIQQMKAIGVVPESCNIGEPSCIPASEDSRSEVVKDVDSSKGIIKEQLYLSRHLHRRVMESLDAFDRASNEPLLQMKAAGAAPENCGNSELSCISASEIIKDVGLSRRAMEEELALSLRLHQKAMKPIDAFDEVSSEQLQPMRAAGAAYESCGIAEPSYVSEGEDTRNEIVTVVNISEDNSKKQKIKTDSSCIVRISRKKFLKIKKSVEKNIFNLEQWIKEIRYLIVNSTEELEKQHFKRKSFRAKKFYDEMPNKGELQKAERISKQNEIELESIKRFQKFLVKGSPDTPRKTAFLPQMTAVNDQAYSEYLKSNKNRKFYFEELRKKYSVYSNPRHCTDRPEIVIQANETSEVINTSVELRANDVKNERNPNIEPVKLMNKQSHSTNQSEMTVQDNEESKINASKNFIANGDENELNKDIKPVDQPELAIQGNKISEVGITSKKLSANDAENESNMNQKISPIEFRNTREHPTDQTEISNQGNEASKVENTSKELNAIETENEYTVNQNINPVEKNAQNVTEKSNSNDPGRNSNDNNSSSSMTVSYPSEYCSIQ